MRTDWWSEREAIWGNDSGIPISLGHLLYRVLLKVNGARMHLLLENRCLNGDVLRHIFSFHQLKWLQSTVPPYLRICLPCHSLSCENSLDKRGVSFYRKCENVCKRESNTELWAEHHFLCVGGNIKKDMALPCQQLTITVTPLTLKDLRNHKTPTQSPLNVDT